MPSDPATGTLYLVGTPIGNLDDMTIRAAKTLEAVDAIACEDTRESRKLLNHLGLEKPLFSYHDHNQQVQGPKIVARLLAGEAIALISDAGMPGISDPGEALVRLAQEAGVRVVPIPGPTAFVAGLVASGLPTGRFVFEGFLSREPKLRRRRLRELGEEGRTLVFYEAPHRLVETLEDMHAIWGEREAAVARELTKLYEEVRRGSLEALAAHYAAEAPRGEIVLVVGGNPAPQTAESGDWEEALKEALAGGAKATEAAKAIAKRFGVSRQEVYDAAQRLREAP